MEIVKVKISDLKPAEYNPRKMNEDQAMELEKSMKKFGLVDPIIVNKHEGRENIVVGGHQRLRVAEKLGYEQVPVYYVNLDEKSERELNLRLNKNTGSWDWGMLANIDADELMGAGFTEKELSRAFDLDDIRDDLQGTDDIPKEGQSWQDKTEEMVTLKFRLPKGKAEEVMLYIKEADKNKNEGLYKCVTLKQ